MEGCLWLVISMGFPVVTLVMKTLLQAGKHDTCGRICHKRFIAKYASMFDAKVSPALCLLVSPP